MVQSSSDTVYLVVTVRLVALQWPRAIVPVGLDDLPVMLIVAQFLSVWAQAFFQQIDIS